MCINGDRNDLLPFHVVPYIIDQCEYRLDIYNILIHLRKALTAAVQLSHGDIPHEVQLCGKIVTPRTS